MALIDYCPDFILGPLSPSAVSVDGAARDAIVSFPRPERYKDVRYYIEYFPLGHEEYVTHVETPADKVKLRGLEPGVRYLLRVFSLFHNIPSQYPAETQFSTQG